jgi:hypothetical protein
MSMKKTFLMLTTAILLLCMLQGGVSAQQTAISPTSPDDTSSDDTSSDDTRAIRAIRAISNGPGEPATRAVRAIPPKPAAVTLQAAIEKAEDAVNEPSEAGESSTNPVVPKRDNSQGEESYIAVLKPIFDQVVWVEAPSAAPGWEFTVLRGARRITQVDLPGFENDLFIILFSLPDRSTSEQVEVKGSEKYQFRTPIKQFVIKRKNRTTGKISVGLHYTGSGKTKLGMTPVN